MENIVKLLLNRITALTTTGALVLGLLLGFASLVQANGGELRSSTPSWMRDYDSRHREFGGRAREACSSSPVTTCNGLACRVQADEC